MTLVYEVLLGAWVWLARVQRDIQAEVAATLEAFAASGDWGLLLVFLPWGVAFGATHALTPGHSKTLLATVVAGSGMSLRRGLRAAGTLAATHIGVSVLIVLLGLPVVSFAFGETGRAAVMEHLSRGLLGIVGVWFLVSAFRSARVHVRGGEAGFGVMAGLIPCPLTLVAMTYAASRGVPEAGLAFAAMMLLGVGLVLVTVAAAAVAVRSGAETALSVLGPAMPAVSRVALGLTGAVLILAAARQILGV